jgi:hypothetical protein
LQAEFSPDAAATLSPSFAVSSISSLRQAFRRLIAAEPAALAFFISLLRHCRERLSPRRAAPLLCGYDAPPFVSSMISFEPFPADMLFFQFSVGQLAIKMPFSFARFSSLFESFFLHAAAKPPLAISPPFSFRLR